MARIVDTLRLQHQHPERLHFAMDAMKEHGYKTWQLQLLKELGNSFVYKILDAELNSLDEDFEEGEGLDDEYEDENIYDDSYDVDEDEVNTYGCESSEAVVADSEGNVFFTTVLSHDGNHFTTEEIRKWRYDFFESLLDISRKEHYMSKEECLEEIVGMTNYYVASIMSYNTPEGYADIVTM